MTGFLIRIFDAGLGWVADWLQSLERHRELRDQVCWNKFDAMRVRTATVLAW